nr:Chain A, TYR-THR-ILE-ALA-ALA-LEU [Homo sapiens]
YTIAAL